MSSGELFSKFFIYSTIGFSSRISFILIFIDNFILIHLTYNNLIK
nr:MAG TPA: hypothetical protein [Caudoviricetes sp.]DAX13741.1 MAG TPA: hypothetical protein [Bacteriophage sp.]DAX38303.1 MAG TPA: hypothetical protein [Caudoviricetes sp.]